MKNAVWTNKLSKIYNRAQGAVLADLDLCIEPGQLFGLVGPDGAGKTTTLRILSSVLPPTSGKALIFDCDTQKEAEKVRQISGYMPQNFSLYPDLSVSENLNFFADLHGYKGEHRKTNMTRLLEFSRLAEFTDRRSEQLSGGMRKKLALACAMIHEPKLLLLDEPTTGVDPVSRRELWDILAEVVSQGVTVLLTTPYMDEAERCNQLVILNQGRVLTSGAPREMITSFPFSILELQASPRSALESALKDLPGLHNWRTVGSTTRLSVEQIDPAVSFLREKETSGAFELGSIHPGRAGMEDLFIFLAEQNRGHN